MEVGWFRGQEWEIWRRPGRWTYFPLLTVPADSKLGIYPALPGGGLCFSTCLWLYVFCEMSSSPLVYLVVQFPLLPLSSRKWPALKRLYPSAVLITVMLIPLWISLLLCFWDLSKVGRKVHVPVLFSLSSWNGATLCHTVSDNACWVLHAC